MPKWIETGYWQSLYFEKYCLSKNLVLSDFCEGKWVLCNEAYSTDYNLTWTSLCYGEKLLIVELLVTRIKSVDCFFLIEDSKLWEGCANTFWTIFSAVNIHEKIIRPSYLVHLTAGSKRAIPPVMYANFETILHYKYPQNGLISSSSMSCENFNFVLLGKKKYYF